MPMGIVAQKSLTGMADSPRASMRMATASAILTTLTIIASV